MNHMKTTVDPLLDTVLEFDLLAGMPAWPVTKEVAGLLREIAGQISHEQESGVIFNIEASPLVVYFVHDLDTCSVAVRAEVETDRMARGRAVRVIAKYRAYDGVDPVTDEQCQALRAIFSTLNRTFTEGLMHIGAIA